MTKYTDSCNFKHRSLRKWERHSDSQMSLHEGSKEEYYRCLRARRSNLKDLKVSTAANECGTQEAITAGEHALFCTAGYET